MKPAFALSLSFDGIALLHRAAGGWRTVGEVSLDTADLTGDLSALREKALRIAPGELRCKVIIPNDQVRYLSVETGSFTGEARDEMVRTTLDGATPYAIDELAFDTTPDGAMTHIAAVARETLDEAEDFASEHGFSPVSFVAVPGDNPFLGEPFFGAARGLGKKERVEPDGVAVVVVGPAVIPAEHPAPAKAPSGPVPSFASRRSHSLAPAYDVTPDGEAPAPRITLGATAALASELAAEPEEAVLPDEVEDLPAEAEAPAPEPVDAGTADPTLPAEEDVAEEVAAEESDHDDLPEEDFAETDDQHDHDLPEPVFVDLPEDKPKRGTVAAPALAVPDEAAPAEGFAAFLTRRTRPARSETASAPRPALGPATANGPVPPAARPVVAPIPQRQVPQDEAARMTVFGARNNETISTDGRRIGLIVTGGLLALLTVIAIWASLFLDDGVAGLFRSGTPERTEIALRPATVPAPAVQSDEPVLPVAPVETGDVEPATQLTTGEAAATDGLSATDAAVLDALRGAAEPDPAAEETVDAAPEPDVPVEPEASPEAPAEVETAMLSNPDVAVEDEALADGEPIDEPVVEAQPEEPLTDAARYAATGIWPTAPEVPETPSIIGIDDLYIASIDRSDLAQDAIALVSPAELDTDRPPGTQNSPAAATHEFQLDSAGLVEATREGTLNPDGVMVYAGRPSKRPPNRPAVADTPPPVNSAELARLAKVRPKLRPADISEKAERSELGGLTRAELAAVRPRPRPASLSVPAPAAAEPEAAPETAETERPSAGSALAVSSSPRPDARPAGFASLVARATPTPTPSPQADQGDDGEPDTVASAAPRIPTSASVARQATMRNAINLRQMNLIGVYGTPSNRRALIRLPSGRYKKVQVGDTVDGGRIVAIGDGELRYQKGGRNLTLKVPSG
ncbi:hypothetical protein [Seohaeicola zhoushanensis]|nr:hypothetical protein [Seohaeicola zhoushanensis]